MSGERAAGYIGGTLRMIFPVFKFLAIKPEVSVEGDKLIACSSLAFKLITLFTYITCVTVDKRINFVTIEKRYVWFFTSKQIIHFNNIKKIAYTYGGYMTDFNSRLQKSDEIDEFTVSLELVRPPSSVKLFSFIGEGAVDTGITGVLLGDDLVDCCGDQEERSLSYVELLMAFTGKRLT